MGEMRTKISFDESIHVLQNVSLENIYMLSQFFQ